MQQKAHPAAQPRMIVTLKRICSHAGILEKPRRQRPMFDRIVKRKRLIQVYSAFREVSREHQGRGHGLMPAQERDLSSLFLGKRQQLLAVAALDSVELQEPRNVSRLQAALRQLVSADLGF